jgi:hypothetical protein
MLIDMLNNATKFLGVKDPEMLYRPFVRETLVEIATTPQKDFAGHGKGGTNYWVNDNRPTKQEALDRINDFRESRDVGFDLQDEFDPDREIVQLPWWIVVPLYTAPYLAEVLIEIDPLDRIED